MPGPAEPQASADADIKHTLVKEAGRGSPRAAASSCSVGMVTKQSCDDCFQVLNGLLEKTEFLAGGSGSEAQFLDLLN